MAGSHSRYITSHSLNSSPFQGFFFVAGGWAAQSWPIGIGSRQGLRTINDRASTEADDLVVQVIDCDIAILGVGIFVYFLFFFPPLSQDVKE